jgi:hypothetical protein
MKALLPSLLGLALLAASPASAASFSISGSITTSDLAGFVSGSPIEIFFDYDASNAGSDMNAGTTVGLYAGALSSIVLRHGGNDYVLSPGNLIVTDQLDITGLGDSFAPQFGGFPDMEGLNFQDGEFRLFGGEGRWATDAIPSDILNPSWISGRLRLTFTDSEEETYTVNGSLNPSTLEAVPEPSAAGLVGMVMALTVFRRRRGA